jgi:hypothetical protein
MYGAWAFIVGSIPIKYAEVNERYYYNNIFDKF